MIPDENASAAPVVLVVDFTGLSTQRTLAPLVTGAAIANVTWLDPLAVERVTPDVLEGVDVVIGHCMTALTALELAANSDEVRLVLLVEPQRATGADLVEEYLAAVQRLGVDAGQDVGEWWADSTEQDVHVLADRLATDLWQHSEGFALAQGFAPTEARSFADELGCRHRRWLGFLASAVGRDVPRLGETPVCLLGDASLGERVSQFADASSRLRTVIVDDKQIHSSAEAADQLRAELESMGA